MTAKVYDFAQVDAFTDKPLSGNPCAIVFDADDLTEAEMLAINGRHGGVSVALWADREAAIYRRTGTLDEPPRQGIC